MSFCYSNQNPPCAYLVSVLTLAVYFFRTDAQQLLGNIVNPLPQHAPFDGVTNPIKSVPNWAKLTESERKMPFGEIPSEKFIDLPPYIPQRLEVPFESLKWNNAAHDDIRNEKITYSVPYMGSYELDGQEHAGSHAAVDIKVPIGTPVYAIANGVVTKAQNNAGGFGLHIVIRHSDMPSRENSSQSEVLHSSYSHLSQLLVAERQVVTKGQLIAYAGDTGFATTPHVHFQIDRDSAAWHPYWPFSTSDSKAAD